MAPDSAFDDRIPSTISQQTFERIEWEAGKRRINITVPVSLASSSGGVCSEAAERLVTRSTWPSHGIGASCRRIWRYNV